MRLSYTRLCPWIPLLVTLVCTDAWAADAWWAPLWRYRRQVTIDSAEPTGLSGDDIVHLAMDTGGLCRRDGSDIRVVTGRGRQVACKVLMMGPGDRASIAFARRGGTKKYYVYFGNPKAPPRREELEIRRGVLLATRLYKKGGGLTLKEARRTIAAAGTPVGRSFRDRIFLGYNPFGPQTRITNTFTAYLVCPKDGVYTFCSSSDGPSFLLVGDTLVVDNAGWHGPQRDISQRGMIKLKAGLHKLTFYHVNRGRGGVVAVAAWRPPGEMRVRVIPPGAYAMVHVGKGGIIEQYGKSLNIDFVASHEGETFMANRYLQRYRFRALADGVGARKLAWKWDFGDGLTSTDADVQHVYLTDGVYKVTLRTRGPWGELARTNRISVSRPWDRVTHRRLDSIDSHAHIVAAYDFAKLTVGAAEAFDLLKRAGQTKAMLDAGIAFLKRPTLPGRTVQAIVPACAEAILRDAQTQGAITVLLRGADKSDDPATSAQLMVLAARLVLAETRDADRAMKLYKEVVQRYGRKPKAAKPVREARIGLGDVWRFRGDYDKAARAYASAGVGPEAAGKNHPILRGDYAMHVEAYIRSRRYDWARQYLDRWERTFPMDKLVGYSTLLRVRLSMLQKRDAAAACEAEALVRVNPASNYGAQLLVEAAEAYRRDHKPDQAAAALKRVVEQYPESQLAGQAKKMLKK